MKKLYLLAAAALCAATATAANGDVTDGWLMLEDFEGTAPTLSTFKTDGSGVGTGTSEVAVYTSKDGNVDNHVGKFTAKDQQTDGFLLTVALPAGKTIADYTAIKLDLVGINTQYKNLDLYIDGNFIYSQGGNPIAEAGKWNTHSHDIDVTGNETTITIGFYNYLAGGDEVAFDNIQLKEKEGGSGENPNPDPDPTPGDYDASKNGTVTDGWLMIEDYQKKQPGEDVTVGSYWGGNANGMSAKIEVDPMKATNLVASATLTGSDWNSVFALDVVLPEGTTLKDYSAIAFDIYRTDQEGDKQIVVNAKYEYRNEFIKPEGNNEEIKTGEWITKEYAISENTQVGNSFKLYFGIKSGNANYAVDNIRLKAKEAPKPELEVVGEPEITVKHGSLAGIIIVSYNFELTNYNGEEIKVVASVEGHPEVSFEKVAKPANVQALAANETFSGDLKAQHDVLTTINNPNVTLTATAGEKQLFTKTKTPDTTTGIEDVTVDSEAPVEYFNLQGLRVAQPEAGQLYIKRQGDKAVKVRF